MKTDNRVNKLLCGFAMALVIITGALAVFQCTVKAAAYGIYTVTATPYYAHPVTGEIEDAGKNPGIGQGMTESVLKPQALLEVDENGNHFVTVRFCLMDNIENVNLAVQTDAQSEFKSVEHTIMKEAMEDASSDLRFEIPDENAIVRAIFYVVPMGRDVVFYMTFSDPVTGSGDFETSIKIDESVAAQKQETSTQTSTQASTAVSTPSVSDSAVDANAGLTVYENSDDSGEQADSSLGQFILIAIAIIAVIAIAGVLFYKNKVGKVMDGDKEQDGGKTT